MCNRTTAPNCRWTFAQRMAHLVHGLKDYRSLDSNRKSVPGLCDLRQSNRNCKKVKHWKVHGLPAGMTQIYSTCLNDFECLRVFHVFFTCRALSSFVKVPFSSFQFLALRAFESKPSRLTLRTQTLPCKPGRSGLKELNRF